METIKWETVDSEGYEQEISIPAKYEVCPKCKGKGTHWHEAFDNGITSEEWYNDWHPDEREALLSGRYDVTCTECRGLRVVLTVDEEACDPAILKAYTEWLDEEIAYRAMVSAERRMGA